MRLGLFRFLIVFVLSMTHLSGLAASSRSNPGSEILQWFVRAELRLLSERILVAYRDDHPRSLISLKLIGEHLDNLSQRLDLAVERQELLSAEAERLDDELWARLREVHLFPHQRMDRGQRFLWLRSLLSGKLDPSLVDQRGPVGDLLRNLRVSSIMESLEEVSDAKKEELKDSAAKDELEDMDVEELLEARPKPLPSDPHFVLSYFPAPKFSSPVFYLSPQNVLSALMTEALERSLSAVVERLMQEASEELISIRKENFHEIPLFEVKELPPTPEQRPGDYRFEISIYVHQNPAVHSSQKKGIVYRMTIVLSQMPRPELAIRYLETDSIAEIFMQNRDLCRRLISRNLVAKKQ